MDKPSTVAMDANVCITHAMNLGVHWNVPLHDFDCKFVRCLVSGCQRESIRIGTFQKTKKHSYENLAERIDELAKKCHFKQWYAMRSLYVIGEQNLDKLFLKLVMFPDSWTPQEITDAERFFMTYGNDVATFTNPQKSKVPERHDLEFLVSSHNLGHGIIHIVSDDSHFTRNGIEIEKAKYNVRIIAMEDLPQVVVAWGWQPT